MKPHTLRTIHSVFFAAMCTPSIGVKANTGPAASVFPIEQPLTIDGDLSDWPDNAKPQVLPHFDFEVSQSRPSKQDASGEFKAGYHAATHTLFIAVSIEDDVFVTERAGTSLPNGLGTNPDGALVYLDLKNISTFADNIELSYVSRPIAAADQALLPDGIVNEARKRIGTQVNYEWQINMPDLFRHQRIPYAPLSDLSQVIGLDVLYFDRDSDSDGDIIKWTFGPNDGQDNRLLGDLFIAVDDQPLYRVSGEVAWQGDRQQPPEYAFFQRIDNAGYVVPAKTHPNGEFHAKLPAGRYLAYAADQRVAARNSLRQEVIIAGQDVNLDTPLIATKNAAPLDTLIPEMMAEQGVRAVGIAAVEKGRISQLRSYGIDAHDQPINADTLFRVASITKPISTMAVLKRVDAGLLSLDMPLSEHWVDPDIADDDRHKRITARQALRHLTGLLNWRGQQGLSFLSDPGKQQSYSGEGFEYMRRALEKQSGQTLQALAAKTVFAPADMTHTSYQWQPEFATVFAGEYFATGVPVSHYTGPYINAAANLLSTPKDLAKFAIWMMQDDILSPSLYQDMITANPDSLFSAEQESMARHGLGWLVHDIDGTKVLEHSGGQWGIRTHLIVLPEKQQALVVLTNSSSGWPLIRAAFDEILNKDGNLSKLRDTLYPLGDH